jgi:hypothetical protein
LWIALWAIMIFIRYQFTWILNLLEIQAFGTLEGQVQPPLNTNVDCYEEILPQPGSQEVMAGLNTSRLGASLIPPLSDELVERFIWPKLQTSTNISLIWRARRISRSWRSFVGRTPVWLALEMVRVDTPGYLKNLVHTGRSRPSLRSRVLAELLCVKEILSESIDSLESFGPTVSSASSEECYSIELEEGRNIRWGRREYLCYCHDIGMCQYYDSSYESDVT